MLPQSHVPAAPGSDLLVDVDVLAIRHGQTGWNAEHRWQGWADVELDEVGRHQAEVGARRLIDLLARRRLHRPVEVVTSDLVRAQQTAAILASAIGVVVSSVYSDLRERNIGDWSGCTTSEIEGRWPGQLDAWRSGELPSVPGGEDEGVLRRRITSAIEGLCTRAQADGSLVVAVTHGGVIGTLQQQLGVPRRPILNLGAAAYAGSPDGFRFVRDLDLFDPGVSRTGGTAL